MSLKHITFYNICDKSLNRNVHNILHIFINFSVPGDKLNMAEFLWHLVIIDLSSATVAYTGQITRDVPDTDLAGYRISDRIIRLKLHKEFFFDFFLEIFQFKKKLINIYALKRF